MVLTDERETKVATGDRGGFGISIAVAVLMFIVSLFVLSAKLMQSNRIPWRAKEGAERAPQVATPENSIQKPSELKDRWILLTTVISVLAASLVSALQSVADCDI